jgi:DNA-binding NtrC family response regulator
MSQALNPEEPIVFAVDDDASMREALSRLFRSIGMRAQLFASAEDFLLFERPDAPAWLVLDVRLPGLSGLELQRELGDLEIPNIFITGHGDIPMSQLPGRARVFFGVNFSRARLPVSARRRCSQCLRKRSRRVAALGGYSLSQRHRHGTGSRPRGRQARDRAGRERWLAMIVN